MSHCLTPSCPQPQNPTNARFCHACGTPLLVAERYRALNLLGQGGFGRTFRAQDIQSPDQPFCALKQFIPPPVTATAEKAQTLFEQEAQRLQELGHHQQIPRFLDYFHQDPHLYLVQEFVTGTTLAQELDAQGCWSEAQIWELLADLLPVLDYVHRHQVIHRDLKPDNILRRHHDRRLVLVDFGAAKFTSETLLRQTGTIVSSIGYSAPEQLLGRSVYASDLYSLGATCLYLLTAISPHQLYDSLEDAWDWQPHLLNPISQNLGQVLAKLLQRPVKHRYSSAIEVIADLQTLQTPTPTAPAHNPQNPQPNSPTTQLQTTQAQSFPPQTHQPHWQCVKTMSGFAAPLAGVVFSPTGQLIGVSQTGAIKVWDLASQGFLAALGDHAGQIYATLGMGQQLVCAGAAGQLRIWQLETGELLASQTHGAAAIRALAASLDGTWFALAQDRSIQVWQHQQLRATLAAETAIYALRFSPDGECLLAGGYDGKVRFWQLPDLTLIQRLHWQLGPIYTLAISPDSQNLAAAGQDGYLKLRQGQNRAGLKVLSKPFSQPLSQPSPPHRRTITALQFSPIANLLAAAGDDGQIRLWQPDLGELQATLVGHSAAVTCLGFSDDGQWLATGSHDQTMRLWRQTT